MDIRTKRPRLDNVPIRSRWRFHHDVRESKMLDDMWEWRKYPTRNIHKQSTNTGVRYAYAMLHAENRMSYWGDLDDGKSGLVSPSFSWRAIWRNKIELTSLRIICEGKHSTVLGDWSTCPSCSMLRHVDQTMRCCWNSFYRDFDTGFKFQYSAEASATDITILFQPSLTVTLWKYNTVQKRWLQTGVKNSKLKVVLWRRQSLLHIFNLICSRRRSVLSDLTVCRFGDQLYKAPYGSWLYQPLSRVFWPTVRPCCKVPHRVQIFWQST